jgi:hypothetical protein
MNVNWMFSIYPGPKPSVPVPYSPYIDDSDLYQRLYALIEPTWEGQFSRPQRPGHPNSRIGIDLPEDDPRLHQAVEMLRKGGWEPYLGRGFDNALTETHYLVRRIRHYDKKDYHRAEYFNINRWSDMTHVFSYEGMRDGLIVGQVAKAKWKTRYGNTRKHPFYPRLVNGTLKEALEAAGLLGLTFVPVLFDHPEKAKGAFWVVSSGRNMPSCRLPMIENTTGDGSKVKIYDDAGHVPQELVFRRQDVEAMEPFDAALTSPEEKRYAEEEPWERPLIVSAHCRKVMLTQLRMTTVDFVPVRLVDK